ncbi:MAG: sodium:calcium symporter, partial [Candidatus Hinthialibacter sp.]
PYTRFFHEFTRVESSNPPTFFTSITTAYIFFLITFFINFYFIFRGLSKGIERFCRVAMPLLIIMAIIIVIRVITLGAPNPDIPEQNVINGLGYM